MTGLQFLDHDSSASAPSVIAITLTSIPGKALPTQAPPPSLLFCQVDLQNLGAFNGNDRQALGGTVRRIDDRILRQDRLDPFEEVSRHRGTSHQDFFQGA